MTPLIDSVTLPNGRAWRGVIIGAVAALLAVAPAALAQRGAHRGAHRSAQRPEALRGSKASVEKMYDFARRNRFPFYLTPYTLDQAIAKGTLVPLTGDANYELTGGVGFSYATAEARDFITQFAPQYVAACGEPLVVTSAARPTSRQPRNANPHSVHPTGIAVDIRRPYPGPCLEWVRGALAKLESRGIIEATEERHPVHLHLAVLKATGARVALPDLTKRVSVARQPAASARITAVANGELRSRAGSSRAGRLTFGRRTRAAAVVAARSETAPGRSVHARPRVGNCRGARIPPPAGRECDSCLDPAWTPAPSAPLASSC
jgi:hypothetical protein